MDAEARARALDPRHSFIVQAPAGSGKTELLTQRFLLLLGTARAPEEILAMTFTRKAAAEMRARIIHALNTASSGTEPSLPHAKKTYALACQVLQQDKHYHWQLLANPVRLRILTLDAVNSFLTRQLPVLAQMGAPPEITPEPYLLYEAAVDAALADLESDAPWSDAIATLLLQRDNHPATLKQLLVRLLARRDQWLPHIVFDAPDPAVRAIMQQQLASVSTEAIAHLHEIFPREYIKEMLSLARFAADQLYLIQPDHLITACCDIAQLPDDKTSWLGLRALLLTQSETWRKRFDKNCGFPADKKLTDYKQRMQLLIEKLKDVTGLHQALVEIGYTPDKTYSDNQWHVLAALQQVLRVAVAQLKWIFQTTGKMDYTENALAAQLSLGTDEAPTDLALALDYQIQHILIDEFQDTSNSQYRLLEKLTAGWQMEDGRTLFVVGDPMQSIYRFREADVALFIRARKLGIGHLRLQPLTLCVNFRSTPGVVNWLNQHFPYIFSESDDISTGAVAYSPGVAHQPDAANTPPVKLTACAADDPNGQANAIVDILKSRWQENPDEDITILVRSRPHLTDIMPALRAAGIAYRAVDIDPLSSRPAIMDLLTLTRALLDPADRIAWLALLRAPWCGLILADLLILSTGTQTIWQNLTNEKMVSNLSVASQQRVARILPVLENKLYQRQRFALRDWVESTWALLGGAATLRNATEKDEAASFFTLLEKYHCCSEWPDVETLTKALNALYASQTQHEKVKLQVMTMHSSKGLEFSTVILPHLEKTALRDDRELLVWMEQIAAQGGSNLLMAPLPAVGEPANSLYDYIYRQQALRNAHEQSRLLYVAATRAKKQLILVFNQPKNDKPAAGSLLAKLLPALHVNGWQAPEKPNCAAETRQHVITEPTTPLRRLSLDWQNPLTEIRTRENLTFHQKNSGYQLADDTARLTGTVIHQIICQLCLYPTLATQWQAYDNDTKAHWLTQQLLSAGVLPSKLPHALVITQQAIDNLLTDARGRWIIKSHTDAHCELPLTTYIEGKLTQLIIDRTFIDEQGIRWIIDYKIAALPVDPVIPQEIFIQQQVEKYQTQLQNYAAALQSWQPPQNSVIKTALYFPLLSTWQVLPDHVTASSTTHALQ